MRTLLATLPALLVTVAIASAQDASPAAPGVGAPPGPAPNAIAAILSRAYPSVVKIYGAGGFQGIPGYGTGVVVHAESPCVIATSWSIALRTPALKIVTDSGQKLDARLWKWDGRRGLALIQVDGKIPALELGSSDAVKPGDLVYSIGNAFDDAAGDEKCAVMSGAVETIAALDVRVGISDGPAFGKVIIVDAPSNPGTQGGPLLTREGAFVGIMGRIVESKATNTIVSYAIPTATLRTFLDDSLAGKEPAAEAPPKKGTGVETGIRLLDANIVRSPPAWVDRVVPGSPADKAGVRPDDLVFRLDGHVVRSCRVFEDLLRDRAPGERVKLVVKRGDRLLELDLELAARKEN